MAKLSLSDLNESDLKGKRVFMRVDFNVPLDADRVITSDNRIKAAIPSIKYIIEKGGRLILASHLGRPKGEKKPEFSLDVCAKKLSELIGKDVKFVNDCVGDEVKNAVDAMKDGGILLLENLRFYKQEEKNDADFSKQLAANADIYVNDAFGTAHRAHASTEGMTKFVKKSAAGFLMEKELKFLGEMLENPKKPFIAILGGAKVSDKIMVIENLLSKVDGLIIGGGMAYTFLKAKGREIGDSLCEKDKINTAKEIMKTALDKNVAIYLPIDHIVAKTPKSGEDFMTALKSAEYKEVLRDSIDDGWEGVDIGKNTIDKFRNIISKSKTIFWNGPMGVFEVEQFSKGTLEVGKALAESGAVTVVGGGDSASAIKKLKLSDKMTHVSTGGGASMEFVEGKELPGVAALTNK
ncbi:MAG TPA: phosphoglycerate kinase [Candidatus Goldiibacteriota bacterium]|nr:phosphoglycerate kinase [Candidatus Goldiibacteriota bacterium]HPN65686.1 phosphoglycerate kinase [Candidatus Goldiibacteriota bacterium]HRQ44540.1 phosphoglycerate kinase [Candidatus Goldiibacteriota bacterium]